MDRDSYLYVARVEKMLVVKKVDDLSLDEITSLYEKIAKSEGITKEILLEEVEKAREELMEQRDVKA